MDSELRERLQAALSESYQIERELVGGGMSRVFVAQERALGRQVVIKVLPSDLAATVSTERFRREIRLAAQLQHPHIVPLFAAGEAAGLPYFTMPFVSAESLRLHLAGGELPMHDAIRILREVASALEFAHAHGVVHRDVKPDNVLLSGGSAMVTDFGVAKALSLSTESERESSVTSVGIALGTPAYMAPEQAAADARVDHRADIYAFGCLAYEVLCGSTPFSGRSSSGTLAAHVTETPESLERRRASVPPALARLVMSCLQKSPADRPQHASEIVHALDALTTPSGGLPPTAAARPARRPAYLIAAAAIALVAVAYAAARFVGAADAAGKSIAVLPFVSADTASEYFADGMTDDLASALGKVEGLRVAARSSSYSFKGKNADAKEIGAKLNVGSIVEGTVRRAGSRLRVTAELVSVRDGLTLWSDSWDRDAKDVFAVQDEISRAIVRALRIRLSGEGDAKLAMHGTSNTQAHELYLRGRFYTNRFTKADLEHSLGLYRQALALDSTYALAYVGLADSYVNLADDWLAPVEAYPKAKTAAVRGLTLDSASAEAHSAMATIYMWFDWDGSQAERELRRAIELNPGYARAYFYLGRLHAVRLRNDSAAASLRRAIELDPLAPRNHAMLASVLNTEGRSDDAIAAARGALAIDANFGPAEAEIGNALLAKGDLRGAEAAYLRATSVGSMWARSGLAVVAARSGRMADARALVKKIESERRTGYVAGDMIAMAYAGMGDRDAAFRWLDTAMVERSGVMPEVRRQSMYRNLHDDPRWANMLARMGWR